MRPFPRLLDGGSYVAEEATGYGNPEGRIRLLPVEVAHRIAAGEVIERPASAVKELLENSLDAGAGRVSVEVLDGGVSLIRVTDDGSGMGPKDARLSVRRHATSKISSADDLASVLSLGFRGEALHAIGAVSSLTLTTREPLSRTGLRVLVVAGEPVAEEAAAHPLGTTVEVRDLFLNLPVRRGFLGTVRSETSAVISVVQGLALGRPDVGFSLKVDGREQLALPPAAELRERIAQVHGTPLARSLIPLGDEVVSGLVSPLAVSFPTRRYLHVTVNGRVVEPDFFAPAVSKAYADLLPKGRHPAAFLRLEPGAGEVDVNVHPAKSAVRLRGGRTAYPLVVGAIRNALALWKAPDSPQPQPEKEVGLSVVGQFAGRLIVAAEGEELIVLDQHGAHERILYEKLLRNPRQTPVELASPATAHLPEDLAPEVWNYEGELGQLGFRFEPFGVSAVRLTHAPETAGDAPEALSAALTALVGGEDLAKELACKGSKQFGDSLSEAEMSGILSEWRACEFPEVCPHGRPIVRRITLDELLRGFSR
ncbi:DNA mismatch repair endonuclease MutL [Rubrobacter indicoceani]|uniref:DNA mismatch repair endonuclease MutL n=1 Tax=Rubrobacter indicoceani TaxID=2051957 RepID=UPI0013C4AF17|nr:DNA mismatch repair endonuclease MutL [Rubrobacter indicoceani]